MPHKHTKASRFLAALDEDWAQLVADVGPCNHAPKPAREPYEALVRAVAYQQLHARAAEAILGRLIGLTGQFPSPPELIALEEAPLRACGFSARKILTLKALADGALTGLIPNRDQADSMTNDELITQLVKLPGIGRWTVEMLLIYTLDRSDIFPADDFGLRAGYRFLKNLPAMPTPKALAQASQAFSPHKTVAAWYLWRALELPAYQTFKQSLKP